MFVTASHQKIERQTDQNERKRGERETGERERESERERETLSDPSLIFACKANATQRVGSNLRYVWTKLYQNI